MYKLWFVVNVHSTSYTRVYSFRINHCMLVFYHFACAMGTVTGVAIKVCTLSLCMLVV